MNWGIYLDDGTCGTHVYGNVVARTILGGVHYHGGRDNVVENNILIDGRDSQVQYSGYVKGGHPVPMMTETWNRFSGTPAYEKYAGYADLKRSLDDAWQMAGNKFLRNIVCYRNPSARLYAHYSLPVDKTDSDYNLVWHYGRPILTGVTAVRECTGPNQVMNPGFEEAGDEGLPSQWQWQVRPNDSAANADAGVCFAGTRSLRLDGRGTATDSSGQTLRANFVSAEMLLTPGATYRLTAQVRAAAPDTGFGLIPQAYRQDAFWWGRGRECRAGLAWAPYEVVFRLPAPGDPDYHEGMEGAVRVRLDVAPPQGTIWVDEVVLREATPMSEWEAWQAQGLDRHSTIADPRFVNAARDDYRLRRNSPAWALGFKPIPFGQIGPYRDPLRATWPIREAPGAREFLRIDWGPRAQ